MRYRRFEAVRTDIFSAKLAPNPTNTVKNNKYVEKRPSRPSKFIGNSLPFGNKAGMTETEGGAKQHGRASSTCSIHSPRSIAWG
jgi:hypothetical protein